MKGVDAVNPNDVTKAIRALKDSALKVADTEPAIRERHSVLTSERSRTWSAPGSRDEVLANNVRLVDTTCAGWRQDHGAMVLRQLSGYRELRVQAVGTDREREFESVVRPCLPSFHGVLQAPGALTFRDLCGLAPAVVKDALSAMIAATPESAFGLPEAKRTARLAELDAEIADVERQHTELVDAAAEVGIHLPLLDTVRARREKDAKARAIEQARQAERAKQPMAAATV
jgi:hypothetical protein